MQSPDIRGFVVLWYFGAMEELISKDVSTKNIVLILFVAVLIPVVGLFAPYAMASLENRVELSDQGVYVTLIGGVSISWEEIQAVELTSNLPKVYESSGVLGGFMKGDYIAAADSSALKLIINGDAPYVKIQTEEFDVYLNQHYLKKTKKVFQEIQTAFKASKS